MIIKVKKAALQNVLEKAFGVVGRSVSSPVLANVKLTSVGNEAEGLLSATGSDGDMAVIARTTQVEVVESGFILVPTKLLDLVKLSGDVEDVTIQADAVGNCEVSFGKHKSEYRLETEGYPKIEPVPSEIGPRKIDKTAFQAALNKVKNSVATDSIRPQFRYIQIEADSMIACDGSRAHKAEFAAPFSMMLAKEAVDMVLRYCRGISGDEIEVNECERMYRFGFESDDLLIAKHVIDYPKVGGFRLGPALNAQ